MTPDERNLITGLFNRLRSADAASKDAEAEQLIQQQTAALPGAPYLLVQTLLVQEHALSNAVARIKDLEQQAAQSKAAPAPAQSSGGGGFLSGLFGHHTNPAPQQAGQPASMLPPQQLPQAQGQPQPQYYAPAQAAPFPTTAAMAPGSGGGFLGGALKTAAGVAGGALLFEGVQNLLGHNAGPFGPSLGGMGLGGGGFGGGGGFLNTGAGQPEVIERNETVNNYYGDSGDRNDKSGGTDRGDYSTPPTDDAGSSFLGNTASDDNSGLYSTPPTDDAVSNDSDLYSTPPTDDASSFDSGSYDSGGGDDTSLV